MDAGELARAEQDARWIAEEPRRMARAAKVDRFLFRLFIGLPGFCILAAILWTVIAPLGTIPLLLLVLIWAVI